MTIKTKLLTIAIIPIVILLVTGMTLLGLSRDIDRAHTREDLNDKIARMTADLIILTYEYGLTRGDRPRLQWTHQHAAVEAHLRNTAAHFERTIEKSHLREIDRGYKNAGALFQDLCEFDRKILSADPSPRSRDLRNNMINRLILELQTVMPAVDLLKRITNEDQARYLQSESAMIMLFLFSLAALVTSLSYFIIKGISRSLVALQQGMKTVASGDLDHRIRLNSGDELGALARGFDEMTGQLRSVTVSRDELAAEITDREKAEKALREAQRIAHIGSWSLDIMTNSLTWSDEIYHIFEIDPAAFGASYEAFLATVHPDDRKLVNEAYTSSVRNRTMYSIDHRLRMNDGRIKFVHEQCETMYDAEGNPLSSLGTVQDVTARKKAEEQFAQEAAINASMSALSEGVLMAGSVEELSVTTLREAQKITGSRFGFVGHIDKTTGSLVCPTMTHDIWDKCGVAGKSIVFEKHESLFGWVLLHKKPLMTNDPDHDERSTGVPHGHIPIRRFLSVPAMHGDVLIGQIALANAERDYTGEDLAILERLALIYALGIRRKQAEEDLRALNEKLESLVDERTADLEETGRDLRESQKALMNIVDDLNQKTADLEKANAKLSELDRLKSMFIASMSHELRTPLNSIIGFSSILLNKWIGPVTQEQEENLAIILRSGKHLLTLINDVIDVSKVEAGIFESHAEDFDLFEVVSEAVSSLAKEANDKGLAVQVDAVRLEMHTDRRRLLQCLLNLLSNAVKFTESGGIRVQAHLLADGNFTELSVEDTGIGIVDEDLPKLFRPFVRLESPLKIKAPGTGLGLYLSRKLATEVLKGDILYRKGPAHGSRFSIRIPVRV